MGILGKIKIAAVILLALATAGHVFYTLSLKREMAEKDGREALTQMELTDARRDAAAKAWELDSSRRALEASEAVNQRLAGEISAVRAKLKEVYANDEDAETWRDGLCPVGVIDCLLN